MRPSVDDRLVGDQHPSARRHDPPDPGEQRRKVRDELEAPDRRHHVELPVGRPGQRRRPRRHGPRWPRGTRRAARSTMGGRHIDTRPAAAPGSTRSSSASVSPVPQARSRARRTGRYPGQRGSHPSAVEPPPQRRPRRFLVLGGEPLEVRPGPSDRRPTVGRGREGRSPPGPSPARQQGEDRAPARVSMLPGRRRPGNPADRPRRAAPDSWGSTSVGRPDRDEASRPGTDGAVGLAAPPTTLKPVIDALPESVYDNPTWRGMAYFWRDTAMYAGLLAVAGGRLQRGRGARPRGR